MSVRNHHEPSSFESTFYARGECFGWLVGQHDEIPSIHSEIELLKTRHFDSEFDVQSFGLFNSVANALVSQIEPRDVPSLLSKKD